MMKSKTSKIALRLEPELRAAIENAAEQDRRPVASLVRNVLADWVDSRHGERAVAR